MSNKSHLFYQCGVCTPELLASDVTQVTVLFLLLCLFTAKVQEEDVHPRHGVLHCARHPGHHHLGSFKVNGPHPSHCVCYN